MKNTKKLLLTAMTCVLFALTAVLLSDKAAAAAEETTPLTITDESLFETESKDGILTITGFHQPQSGQNITDIVVPAAINGQKVRAIGKGAFSGAGTNIHNLYLPDTLETLEAEAFSSYSIDNVASYTYTATGEFAETDSASIEKPFTETPTVDTSSVAAANSLPASLTRIGSRAFYNSPVKNITFNSQNLIIEANAFENTANLLDVTLNAGASITEIGENAFLNSGIHSFTIDGTIGKIGDGAFKGTANIDRFIVNEGGSISELGASIFETSGIHYVTLRGSVTSIGDRAFASCGNILDVTVASDTPYTLGEYAFNNAGIHSVNFSNGLAIVSKGTFEGCGNLETVHLPDTVTNIAEDAFKNVSNIKEITISDNATVAPNAFEGAGGSTLSALAKTNNANIKSLLGIASQTPQTPQTPVVPVLTPPSTPPAKVTVSAVKLKKAKVNKKKKKVTLTWSKNKNASGYTIYRKVVKNGTKAKKAKKIKFKKLKNVNSKKLSLTISLTKKAATSFYIKAYQKVTVDGKTTMVYSKASNTKKCRS